jgi:hypothetical protein
MKKIEEIVSQNEGKTKDTQQINFYTLVSLKDAIRTIKDLKWTIENGNEDIYEELIKELKYNLETLTILIENNVKKSREDMNNQSDIGETE